MAFEGVNGVVAASIEAINGVAKGDIEGINGSAPPAAATSWRVALVGGAAGEYYWSTGSLDNVGHWHLVDLGTSLHRDVAWGHDSAGNEAWVMSTNQTARPIRVAVSDGSDNWVPSGSGNWTDIDPQGIRDFPTYGYECHYHPNAGAGSASWSMSGVNNSCYAYYESGSMTDAANWNTVYRGFDDSGTNSAIRGPVSNGSSSAADGVYVLAVQVTTGDMWVNHSGGMGTGDSGEWEQVYDAGAGTNRQKTDIAYGKGKWVTLSSATNKDNLTSSNTVGGAKGMEWGPLPNPGTNRAMRGAATNMSGAWVTVGDSGYTWNSDDNAESFSEVRTVSTDGGTSYRNMEDVAFDNNETWLAVGERSFYVSTDNGASWAPFDISATTNRTYYAVAFNTENTSQ
tara:strand:+ start:7414 stop:8607 length:1194 start_codon:yes stop_codon:yes gene_type:complete